MKMKSLTKNNTGIDLDLFQKQRKEMFDAVSEGKLLSEIEKVFKNCRNSQEYFDNYQSIFQGMGSGKELREELAELFETGICNVDEPTPVLDFDDSLIDSTKYPLVYSLICNIKENHKAGSLMFNPRLSGSGYNWFSDRSNYTSISTDEELLSFASKVFVENVFLGIAEARKFSCYFSVKEQRFVFADESSYTYKRDIENGQDPVIDFFKDKIVLDYFTVSSRTEHYSYLVTVEDLFFVSGCISESDFLKLSQNIILLNHDKMYTNFLLSNQDKNNLDLLEVPVTPSSLTNFYNDYFYNYIYQYYFENFDVNGYGLVNNKEGIEDGVSKNIRERIPLYKALKEILQDSKNANNLLAAIENYQPPTKPASKFEGMTAFLNRVAFACCIFLELTSDDDIDFGDIDKYLINKKIIDAFNLFILESKGKLFDKRDYFYVVLHDNPNVFSSLPFFLLNEETTALLLKNGQEKLMNCAPQFVGYKNEHLFSLVDNDGVVLFSLTEEAIRRYFDLISTTVDIDRILKGLKKDEQFKSFINNLIPEAKIRPTELLTLQPRFDQCTDKTVRDVLSVISDGSFDHYWLLEAFDFFELNPRFIYLKLSKSSSTRIEKDSAKVSANFLKNVLNSQGALASKMLIPILDQLKKKNIQTLITSEDKEILDHLKSSNIIATSKDELKSVSIPEENIFVTVADGDYALPF